MKKLVAIILILAAISFSSVMAFIFIRLEKKIITPPPIKLTNLSLILPIYNDRMVTLIDTTFKQYIKDNDVLYINLGSIGQLDVEWINNTANRLKQSFPNNQIVGSTSGLENLTIMAEKISNQIEIINYNYEPNFQNIPEFSWDFSSTLKNVEKAARIAQDKGKKLMTSPTGRPLLQKSLLQYNWNYGEIGKHVDFQIIQTQRYCANDTETFQKAIDKLIGQFNDGKGNWAPQITVSQRDPNGVSPQKGYDCTRVVIRAGIPSLSIWWNPNDPEFLEQYLKLIGR